MRLHYIRYDLRRGFQKIKTRTALVLSAISLAIAGTGGLTLALLGSAHADSPVVYDNIPSPFPQNLSSEGPEAYAFNELGGQVHLDGSTRTNPVITVAMSSWACQTGHWYDGTCSTTTSDTFSWPITLKVYAVNSDNSPGAQLATSTQTFAMPYRPTSNCPTDNTAWKAADGTCYHGKAFQITFNLSNVTLPDNVIVSASYNTSHYGYAPVGESVACYTSSAGCFYDSLNIGLNSPPTVGSDPLPNDAYLYSNVGGAYCPSDQTTTGTFRLDKGCWTGYQPAFRITTANSNPGDACKNGGWQTMSDVSGKKFKNQGDCVSYFATNGKNVAAGPKKGTSGATGNLTLSGPLQTLSFNVTDNGASSADVGTVTYSNPGAGLAYTVNTTCVNVVGNTASFAYQIPSNAPVAANVWVVWRVVDNGATGDTAGFATPADQASATAFCESGNTAVTPYTITSGDVKVQ